MQIALVSGHCPGPDELRDPEWTGYLLAFVETNKLTLGEVNEIKADLAREGFARIGGGAAAEFTIYEACVLADLVGTIHENHDDYDDFPDEPDARFASVSEYDTVDSRGVPLRPSVNDAGEPWWM
jgi:hypothetical protein